MSREFLDAERLPRGDKLKTSRVLASKSFVEVPADDNVILLSKPSVAIRKKVIDGYIPK